MEPHHWEVRGVWEAFQADRPLRVPVIFSGARTLFLEGNRIDYRNYYQVPDEMLRLQLEWQRYSRELPLAQFFGHLDFRPG